jgi:hypothetical protein
VVIESMALSLKEQKNKSTSLNKYYRNEALLLRELIDSHPNSSKLKTTDSGIVARIHRVAENVEDIVTIHGITSPLEETFWPKSRYVEKIVDNVQIKGMLHTFSELEMAHKRKRKRGQSDDDDESDNPLNYQAVKRQKLKDAQLEEASVAVGPPPPKRTPRAILFDALHRGSNIHAQMNAYFEAYFATENPNEIFSIFTNHLKVRRLGEYSPAVAGILSEFKKLKKGDKWYPIATEIPVCDMVNLNKASKKSVGMKAANLIYGTVADAIVYSKARENFVLLEYKTTTGDFKKGTTTMRGELSGFTDSPLMKACVQLTLTIEYFKRTYASLFKSTNVKKLPRNIYGYIIWTDPKGIDTGKFTLTPKFQRRILLQLSATGFFI